MNNLIENGMRKTHRKLVETEKEVSQIGAVIR